MPWSKGRALPAVDNPVDKVDNSSNKRKFNHPEPVVGLFARQPVPGQVKTRLTPPLSADRACRLYHVSLQETVQRLLATGIPLAICYAGRHDWFCEAFPGVPLFAQAGADLGERMGNAVQALFAAGAGPVLLAGTDSPDLPIPLLYQILLQLKNTDVAFVPCQDGGYAVVGMRRPTTQLFAGIPWSTSGVMVASRQRCQQLGLSYYESESWYDLDEPADLQQLVMRSPESQTARHLVSVLSELLS